MPPLPKAPPTFEQRRYGLLLVPCSRGRLASRIVEVLEDTDETFRVRVWDGRAKVWHRSRAPREKVQPPPTSTDSRWADIREDLRLERKVYDDDLAEKRKRWSAAAKLREAKKVLARNGLMAVPDPAAAPAEEAPPAMEERHHEEQRPPASDADRAPPF